MAIVEMDGTRDCQNLGAWTDLGTDLRVSIQETIDEVWSRTLEISEDPPTAIGTALD